MSDIQRRGSYTPRRAREARAYQLVVIGGVSGLAGVVGILLAAVGVVGAGIPIILLLVAIACGFGFRSMTTKR